VEIGLPDDEGFFLLHSAEIFMSEMYGELTAEVNMAAIGSHSAELARIRAANYLKAAEVAELIVSFFEAGDGIEAVSSALTNAGLLEDLDLELIG
jgi:hypothetical protein